MVDKKNDWACKGPLGYSMKIIFLHGKAGSGKDTVGEEICEMLRCKEYSATTIAFADELKSIVADVMGISVRDLNILKNNNDTTAVNAIFTVSDAYKSINPEYFLTKTKSRVDQLEKLGFDYVIITDIRYPIEKAWMESLENKLVIKVVNDNRRPSIRDDHHSEQLTVEGVVLDNTNTGAIDDMIKLRNTVKSMYDRGVFHNATCY